MTPCLLQPAVMTLATLAGLFGLAGLCTGCASTYDDSVTVIQPSFDYTDHGIELVQFDADEASTALAATTVEAGDVQTR